MSPADWFNAAEIVLWSALGLVLLIRGMRTPRDAWTIAAAVAFFSFAGSDAVELVTGAWWRPWWLLVWKAACVTVLAAVFLRYEWRRRRP